MLAEEEDSSTYAAVLEPGRCRATSLTNHTAGASKEPELPDANLLCHLPSLLPLVLVHDPASLLNFQAASSISPACNVTARKVR